MVFVVVCNNEESVHSEFLKGLGLEWTTDYALFSHGCDLINTVDR